MLNKKFVAFICLNPSTADETLDDPTVRRCIDFAKRWGYGAFVMLNLFAIRSTNPTLIKQAHDPIGPDNDKWIRNYADKAVLTVAAWGVHGTYRDRDKAVVRMLNGKLTCLATTKDGHPKHPLYLRKTLTPAPYDP